MRLKNKKAIITGANRSIGRGIALLFAKEGAEVIISYRSDKKGAEDAVHAIQKIGGIATAVHADFTNSDSIENFYRNCLKILGQVDILVNNAAGYNTLSFFDLKPDAFHDILHTNVIAPFFLSQLVAKDMIEQKIEGKIINISSISGIRPVLNRTAHSPSKAALNMLTQCMALELAPYRIRVNAVAPGYTPYDEPPDPDPALKDIPLKRAGLPYDQASAVLFLATEESSWITGQILTVDGGHTIAL